jgi:hypothetical protein
MSDSNYQYVYNVNMLDDLHNYFPDLLYNQEQFQNTPDVLRYIREQTQNRFNLFRRGQNLYNNRDSVIEQHPIQIPPPIRQEESIATTNLLLGLLGASMDSAPILGNRLLNRVMLNPNASVFRPNIQNFMNPVVVHATTQQIENNSEIVRDISGQSCAICQDAIRPIDTCRYLSTCRHVYHQACIDQWFTLSVFCPTCRHDIRERNLQPQQPSEWGL